MVLRLLVMELIMVRTTGSLKTLGVAAGDNRDTFRWQNLVMDQANAVFNYVPQSQPSEFHKI